jgi:D-serine deaminase-like pyridoxal phosphate-dependent protein
MSNQIDKPTLLLHTGRAKRNIQSMAEKAQRHGIRFRPHFKTHQSAAIGEWFRESEVSAITVSSVEMALYFARHGWNDITIAFPVNLRQMAALNELARSIHLGLLVESLEAANFLSKQLIAPADIWIEIDEGSHRSGVDWEHPEIALTVVRALHSNSLVKVRGILTHAGRIYHAGSPDEIKRIYSETVKRMNMVRQFFYGQGFPLEVSIGDTPGCTLSTDLGLVDEIRPGNFVFYDAQQLSLGVCQLQDVAAVVECPVVAKYPQRSEVVVYGGAVHLSKDIVNIDGQNWFGLVAAIRNDDKGDTLQDWLSLVNGGYMARMSQEHGVVSLPEVYLKYTIVGELLYVLPAHVCLTVSALGEYLTTDGHIIQTLNKEM